MNNILDSYLMYLTEATQTGQNGIKKEINKQ